MKIHNSDPFYSVIYKSVSQEHWKFRKIRHYENRPVRILHQNPHRPQLVSAALGTTDPAFMLPDLKPQRLKPQRTTNARRLTTQVSRNHRVVPASCFMLLPLDTLAFGLFPQGSVASRIPSLKRIAPRFTPAIVYFLSSDPDANLKIKLVKTK